MHNGMWHFCCFLRCTQWYGNTSLNTSNVFECFDLKCFWCWCWDQYWLNKIDRYAFKESITWYDGAINWFFNFDEYFKKTISYVWLKPPCDQILPYFGQYEGTEWQYRRRRPIYRFSSFITIRPKIVWLEEVEEEDITVCM